MDKPDARVPSGWFGVWTFPIQRVGVGTTLQAGQNALWELGTGSWEPGLAGPEIIYTVRRFIQTGSYRKDGCSSYRANAYITWARPG